MLQTAIFIGRSGCGKGTQAALLREWILKNDLKKHQILYIESGNEIRQFIRGKGYSNELARETNENDKRLADFLACVLWGTRLVEEFHDKMHLVFDGAPRSRAEAEIMTSALEFYGRKHPRVIYINVSRKWSEERLLARGRSDDKTLTKIDKRLAWFEKDVIPAIEYFKTHPFFKYIEVNGEQSIEKVHQEIIKKY